MQICKQGWQFPFESETYTAWSWPSCPNWIMKLAAEQLIPIPKRVQYLRLRSEEYMFPF